MKLTHQDITPIRSADFRELDNQHPFAQSVFIQIWHSKVINNVPAYIHYKSRMLGEEIKKSRELFLIQLMGEIG